MTCNTLLDNSIWHAATTRQQHLAYGTGPARRYHPEVVPIAGLEDHSARAIAALSALVAPGERIWLFEEPPLLDPHRWRETHRIPGYRMRLERLEPDRLPREAHRPPSLLLDTVRDAPAMNALKAIAFPGFFGMRTPEMGRYRGIHMPGPDGQPELVAMAGERLALPGYREVSAVCTHPAHLGHGYAQRLTREATAAILADGDIPFLHVAAGNAPAQAVYEKLGYTRSANAVFVELERNREEGIEDHVPREWVPPASTSKSSQHQHQSRVLHREKLGWANPVARSVTLRTAKSLP